MTFVGRFIARRGFDFVSNRIDRPAKGTFRRLKWRRFELALTVYDRDTLWDWTPQSGESFINVLTSECVRWSLWFTHYRGSSDPTTARTNRYFGIGYPFIDGTLRRLYGEPEWRDKPETPGILIRS